MSKETRIIWILGALSTITPFSIDMYLPAFGEIAKDLNTSVSRVSLSVSSYFIGLSLAQGFYGPLLDRFGRRRPLFSGLILYLLSTLACLYAPSVEFLIVARFFQAVGGCSASVACTAMVRDFFPANQASKIFSMMMLILGVSPLLAPSVGSFVAIHWGWPSVFGLLGSIAFLIVMGAFIFLPEGHEPDKSVSLKLKPILFNYSQILKNKQFLTYSLAGSFSFAGLFVYITGSPAIFMDTFQVSKQVYGGIFAFLAVGFIGGSQMSILLNKRYSSIKIFDTFLGLQLAFGFLFLIAVLSGSCGFYGTLAFLFIVLTCTGISSPNASALAIEPFTKNLGSASSVLGILQMGIGALMSAGVGMLSIPGILPTVVVLVCSSILGLGILFHGKKRIRFLNQKALH